MKADRPCAKFEPDPDSVRRCYWCRWEEVPHLVPEENEFETTYWETLLHSAPPLESD